MRHVDTASVAEIIKRLLGAEELSGITFLVQYAQWLAETPLVELLLNRLAPGNLLEAQANAADILTAMAHTQVGRMCGHMGVKKAGHTISGQTAGSNWHVRWGLACQGCRAA